MALLSPSRPKAGYKIVLFSFCLAIVVVMLGAFTRLADAGLGCPDWPGCYGHLLWPDEQHEIDKAQQLFPDAPVETDKTWPEMVHRYFAGTLGLFIAFITFKAWRLRGERDYPFRLPLLISFVVVWQALFGMWTVTLKLWPQIVSLHLMGGMTVLSLLWLLLNRLSGIQWSLTKAMADNIAILKPWLIVGIVLVSLQILLGGWTTSNYAAFGCPDFPTCHNDWLPPMDMAKGFDIFQTIGPNYLGGQLENDARVAIHFMHRIGALVVTVFLLCFAVRAFMLANAQVTRLTVIMLAALSLQIILGISNVYFQIPLPVAVAHNAGAGLLLLTLITLASRLWMAKVEEKKS